MTAKTKTNSTSPNDLWAETRRLYENEGLPLSEIAARLGITKQAVHNRLEKAGVRMRSVGGNRKLLARQPLEKLYIDERKSVKAIAAELGLSEYLVGVSLRRHGFAIRSRGQHHLVRFPGFESLKVGESILLSRPKSRGKWQSYFYYAAAKWGFKISVNAVGETEVLVTRKA